MKNLRNFQFLKDTRTCFLNFNSPEDCKNAMTALQYRQLKVEFAKKKQHSSSKKGNNHHQIGRCYQCTVKGHKEQDCYYTGSILPTEIWILILDFMTLSQLGKISKICKYWNSVAFNYWKTIVPLTHIVSICLHPNFKQIHQLSKNSIPHTKSRRYTLPRGWKTLRS